MATAEKGVVATLYEYAKLTTTTPKPKTRSKSRNANRGASRVRRVGYGPLNTHLRISTALAQSGPRLVEAV